MANEDAKDFNAMLRDDKGMPRIKTVTDPKTIERNGGEKMLLAPPMAFDEAMRAVPYGKVVTIGDIRKHLAKSHGADFTCPLTAGIFTNVAAWAAYQRANGAGPAPGAYEDALPTPWWRTLKANGELNPKFPGGVEAHKELLEAEGHRIVARGRKNVRYYVDDLDRSLFDLG